MGATDSSVASRFSHRIGLGLTLIHLGRDPVTNLSVNPARSTHLLFVVVGVARLWMFGWRRLGGALGGALYTTLFSESAVASDQRGMHVRLTAKGRSLTGAPSRDIIESRKIIPSSYVNSLLPIRQCGQLLRRDEVIEATASSAMASWTPLTRPENSFPGP